MPKRQRKPIELDEAPGPALSPKDQLLEDLDRFKKNLELNKPISAAWCTSLISRATELRT